MDMQSLTAQWCKVVELELLYKTEFSAYAALVELKLTADGAALAAAYRRMTDESPLFVRNLHIVGRVCQPMYDHDPDLAYFFSPGELAFDAPRDCRLSAAMELGEQLPLQVMDENASEETHAGLFLPESVVLYSQFGTPVQCYGEYLACGGQVYRGWLASFPDAAECERLEARACQLSAEAERECAWDNHDTARGLRKQAEAIRLTIAIAQVRDRIIV